MAGVQALTLTHMVGVSAVLSRHWPCKEGVESASKARRLTLPSQTLSLPVDGRVRNQCSRLRVTWLVMWFDVRAALNIEI
jgi:hypothetical protein